MRQLIISALLFISFEVRAIEPMLSGEIPLPFERPALSLLNFGLGPVCSVIKTSRSALPCVPMGFEPDERGFHSFNARLFVGSEYARFQTIDRILHGPHDPQFVESLFRENQVIDTLASGEVSLRWRRFGLGFTPYHLSYFSVVRNEAYPVIALRAMKERIWRGQGSFTFGDGFSAGLQLRFVERMLIQNEFSMYEAILEGQNVLPRREQNSFYIEPGFSWNGDNNWKPKAGIFLSNTGFTNNEIPETKQFPVIDIGGGLTPPIGFGEWEFGANYRVTDMSGNIWDRFSLGVDYELGLIEGLLAWSPSYTNVGLMSSFWSAHVAILFSSRRFEDPSGRFEYGNSILTEFGFEF